MEELISELRHYKNIINLEERYDWQIPLDECNFITNEEKEEINNESSNFKKNIVLKRILNVKLNNDFNQPDIHYWIVKKWGAIKNFKRNDKNDKKISDFRSRLTNNLDISPNSFSIISSLSKIASFADTKNYFIYDSRVIYSLNWLLLKYPTENMKFFPSPPGRNNIINNYNLCPIINFQNNSPYYGKKTAYKEYCNLVKNISAEIFADEPFLLEMLLFVISIEEIVKDAKANLQISIKSVLHDSTGT